MNKPKEKWWSVTKHDLGREFANPDYVRWADERISALENELAKFTSTNKQSTQNYACPKCSAELTGTEYRSGECYSCCSSISA